MQKITEIRNRKKKTQPKAGSVIAVASDTLKEVEKEKNHSAQSQ